MGLFSFIKDVGEKLFGGEAKADAAAAADEGARQTFEADAATKIREHVAKQGLAVENLGVSYAAASRTATISGTAADQATKEKAILAAGNVEGVASVEDQLAVAAPAEPEAKFYTVVKGDTLSKIAKEFYGNANSYMKIFEANKPMLAHPDKIYPGQVLRIPD